MPTAEGLHLDLMIWMSTASAGVASSATTFHSTRRESSIPATERESTETEELCSSSNAFHFVYC